MMSYALGKLEVAKKLTDSQVLIMREFYKEDFQTVILNKNMRQKIWQLFKENRDVQKLGLDTRCPALIEELNKSLTTGKLIQSAIFSECVYAQTLANILNLTEFSKFAEAPERVNQEALKLLNINAIYPRYIYWSPNQTRLLVQAGGPGGVDSALIDTLSRSIIRIEFKEALAKTSEADLPKYTESGLLEKTKQFIKKYPQFELMLDEQISKELNFFAVQGSNVNDFSSQSISAAVDENYAAEKFADVICVEDNQGFLSMIPANDLTRWSNISGEIRPAGRNKYAVFTPKALANFISDAGGKITEEKVMFPVSKMKTAAKRGGNGEVNRWKINSLFFIYASKAKIVGDNLEFNLRDVRQLKPTVSAHMDFQMLNVDEIAKFYESSIR